MPTKPPVYKICEAAAWLKEGAMGAFTGSADDQRDGYIHFSTAAQLPATLAKHFAGRADLVLLTVAVDRLDAPLKWEPSRGGALFPHLYAPLPATAVVAATPLPLDADGRHCLPASLGLPPAIDAAGASGDT